MVVTKPFSFQPRQKKKNKNNFLKAPERIKEVEIFKLKRKTYLLPLFLFMRVFLERSNSQFLVFAWGCDHFSFLYAPSFLATDTFVVFNYYIIIVFFIKHLVFLLRNWIRRIIQTGQRFNVANPLVVQFWKPLLHLKTNFRKDKQSMNLTLHNRILFPLSRHEIIKYFAEGSRYGAYWAHLMIQFRFAPLEIWFTHSAYIM